jgi:hypothetical protein
MNSKDNFDVLKKMASRSSEIRRSDPLSIFGRTAYNSKEIIRTQLTLKLKC